MSADVVSKLEQHMAGFKVQETEKALGQRGTSFSVAVKGETVYLSVVYGFPVKRSREARMSELRQFVADLALDRPVAIDLSWQVSAHSVQPGVKALPNIRNIIAIASGKGGVGKSTVTTNLALALAQEGARVGILDADIYGPSQPRALNLIGERPETVDGKTMRPLSAYGVSVMSIGFLVDEKQAVAWRGPMVTSALNQMLTQTDWGDLDYLFVDMPPGTGDIQLTLAQKVPVSGAAIVTTPQDVALADARKGLEMFAKVKLPVLGVIENMGVHVCGQCGHAEHLFGHDGGARLAAEYDLPLLGALPLVPSVMATMDAGRPIVISEPNSPIAAAFREVALRLAGELAATARDYSHLFPNISVEGKG